MDDVELRADLARWTDRPARSVDVVLLRRRVRRHRRAAAAVAAACVLAALVPAGVGLAHLRAARPEPIGRPEPAQVETRDSPRYLALQGCPGVRPTFYGPGGRGRPTADDLGALLAPGERFGRVERNERGGYVQVLRGEDVVYVLAVERSRTGRTPSWRVEKIVCGAEVVPSRGAGTTCEPGVLLDGRVHTQLPVIVRLGVAGPAGEVTVRACGGIRVGGGRVLTLPVDVTHVPSYGESERPLSDGIQFVVGLGKGLAQPAYEGVRD